MKSLVRKTLAVKDHCVEKVFESERGLEIHLKRRRLRRLPCSVCATRSKPYDTLKERTWTHVPLWGIEARIYYAPTRVLCKECGQVKVEKIPWGEGKSRLSKPLVILLATWAKLLPIDTVCRLFQLKWATGVASAGQTSRGVWLGES